MTMFKQYYCYWDRDLHIPKHSTPAIYLTENDSLQRFGWDIVQNNGTEYPLCPVCLESIQREYEVQTIIHDELS